MSAQAAGRLSLEPLGSGGRRDRLGVRLVARILQRINQVLRARLMDRIQALSLRFHAESRVGDAMRS